MATDDSPSTSSPLHINEDSPYSRAVQIKASDPASSIEVFLEALKSGDQPDLALNDMVEVMVQLRRVGEAIEAISAFGHLCSAEACKFFGQLLIDLKKDWNGFVPVGMYTNTNKIKDQGDTYFCLFFASTSAWEAKLRIQNDVSVDLSIQQLLDVYWGAITSTGVCREAFLAFIDSTSTTTSHNYPYSDGPLSRKPFKPTQFVPPFYEATWKKVELGRFENYEDAMLEALKDNHQLFCFVHASRKFMEYSGDFVEYEAQSGELNHGVVILKGGDIMTPNGMKPYWLIQNSHGKKWGYNGLMFMERGKNCMGIGLSAYYPVLDHHPVGFPNLKHDWPVGWRKFIRELVEIANTSETTCKKCMATLKLLKDACFGFSRREMTQKRTNELKESLVSESKLIHKLCLDVLSGSQQTELNRATLTTLHAFIQWVPMSYIFESPLLENLFKFFPMPAYHNLSHLILQCLTEVATLNSGDFYDKQYVKMYNRFMVQVQTILPLNSNIPEAYANGTTDEQAFIHNLALFFTAFFKSHIRILESDQENVAALLMGLEYLINISYVDDTKVLKDCLDYWNSLVLEFIEAHHNVENPAVTGNMMGMQGMGDGTGSPLLQRRQIFASTMSKLRMLMICRMAKPEEVLIVKDENGNIIRETMKNNDVLVQFKIMRETLVNLTHLDHDDTKKKMLKKLNKQLNGEDLSWNNLNTLCWAIGSISGSMLEDQEYKFLVMVIPDLLKLYEIKVMEDDKAVIASNIMYIFGQCPRILRALWNELKLVAHKLFEFMHVTYPGVQDMACDTFLKIVQNCKHSFVIVQAGENEPFVSDLLKRLSTVIRDLKPHQIHTFYETVGHMIQAESDPQKRDEYLERLMEIPNQTWAEIIGQAQQSVDILKNPVVIKAVLNMLQANTSAATSLGTFFFRQIQYIFQQGKLLDFYRMYSELISNNISEGEPYFVELLRSVKREILKLLETFLEKAEELQLDETRTQFLFPMMNCVLSDYASNVTDARESEVLSLSTTIINKYKAAMIEDVPGILKAVFECTMEMIKNNFEDYPEHRLKVFSLLRAIATHCFPALVRLSPQQLKLVMHSIFWAFHHTDRNIAETGLKILLEMLKNFQDPELCNPEMCIQFYGAYFFTIEEEIFKVLTDTSHKPGFKLHVLVLQHLFCLVKSWALTKPDIQELYLRARKFTTHLFSSSFPNMTAAEVTQFVNGLFELANDLSTFKVHVRDFLVQSKEFSAQDNEDLYAEDS